MSGLCGVVHFDGAPVDPQILSHMATAASHRGPDGTRFWTDDAVGFAHLVHHVTPESCCEQQPLVSEDGRFALNADARIDNREELSRTLKAKGYLTEPNPTDADLILAAYRCWDTDCPSHLIGDFAFAIWGPDHRIGHFWPPRAIAEVLERLVALVFKCFRPEESAYRVADAMIEARFGTGYSSVSSLPGM